MIRVNQLLNVFSLIKKLSLAVFLSFSIFISGAQTNSQVPILNGNETWKFCSNERSTCTVPSRAIVRYGAAGKFNSQYVDSSVRCDNNTFGDPAPGVRKTCEYTLAVAAPLNNTVFQQIDSNNNIISIEAEHYHAQVNGNKWQRTKSVGASGGAGMQVAYEGTNLYGVNFNVNPRLDYKVNFRQAGIYYVWIRGLANDSSTDSLHVGLNNSQFQQSDKISSFSPYGQRRWSNNTMDGAVATIEVSSAGVHTVNVWQREDGFLFDKLVLTRDANYRPDSISTYGPLESPRTQNGEQVKYNIQHETWSNINGTDIRSLTNNVRFPSSPDSQQQLYSFDIPTFVANNYGSRVSGILVPPETGDYTFWVSGDDSIELWLSMDADPANKSLIASVPSWTYHQQWDLHAQQRSAAIYLEAGKRYYIEALHKEGYGGDSLSVAWQKPGSQQIEVLQSKDFIDTSASPALPALTGIQLVEETTDLKFIQAISEGGTVDLKDLPARFNFTVISSDITNTGSIAINMNGCADVDRYENNAPYTVNNQSVGFTTLASGACAITATPYELPDLGGEVGQPLTVNFHVMDSTPKVIPNITGLYLVEDPGLRVIQKINTGSEVDLNGLPARFNFTVTSADAANTGSVDIKMSVCASLDRYENYSPYTVNNEGVGFSSLALANCTITATPYELADKKGEAGTPFVVQFSVVDTTVPLDSDNDGIPDVQDDFPNNPDESKDSDGDGVGDKADAFPNDPNEDHDTDKDGVGDNADAFPNDATETKDSDGDGVGDNKDTAPNDPNVSERAPSPTGSVFSIQPTAYTGTTAGDFKVNQNGAATYNIKLSIPAGTAGVQPELSLNYNSSASNGLLGQGWSLTGLSAISRCGKNYATDNEVSPIKWNDEDRYCLDGQRLIVVKGHYGAPGSVYKTELDSYIQVMLVGGDTLTPDYFKVLRKDGSVTYYGATDDSRQEVNVKLSGIKKILLGVIYALTPANEKEPQVLSWAKNQVVDSAGNKINFLYHKDDYGHRIQTIRYAYGQGNNHHAEVNFKYHWNSDGIEGYISGYYASTKQRLHNIEVRNYNNAQWHLLRSYRLHYKKVSPEDGITMLHQLQECSASGCMAPTTFDWQEPESGFKSSKAINVFWYC